MGVGAGNKLATLKEDVIFSGGPKDGLACAFSLPKNTTNTYVIRGCNTPLPKGQANFLDFRYLLSEKLILAKAKGKGATSPLCTFGPVMSNDVE